MRRLILTAFWVLSCFTIKAQSLVTHNRYNLVTDSRYNPYTYQELLQMRQSGANLWEASNPNQYRRYNKYEDNRSAAYSALHDGNKDGFLFYSDIALSTRYSDAQLYYDRGVVFEERCNFKNAKKAYKKAKKKGMYKAAMALEQCKNREKEWERNLK